MDGGIPTLLPKQRLIAVYMSDADLLRRQSGLRLDFWQEQLQQTIYTQARLRNFNWETIPFLVAANSSRLDCVCGHGWLAVGDAAIAFDPLSSQGLLQALASGIRAGETTIRLLAGEAAALGEYGSGAQRVFAEYARQHCVYYGRERRWPRIRLLATPSSGLSAMRRRNGEDQAGNQAIDDANFQEAFSHLTAICGGHHNTAGLDALSARRLPQNL